MKKKKKHHNNLTAPRKFYYCSEWRHDQDAVFWVKLEEQQNFGLQFGQTKSNAIIVYRTVPAECNFKIIFKNNMKLVKKGYLSTSTKGSSQKPLASNSSSSSSVLNRAFGNWGDEIIKNMLRSQPRSLIKLI